MIATREPIYELFIFGIWLNIDAEETCIKHNWVLEESSDDFHLKNLSIY